MSEVKLKSPVPEIGRILRTFRERSNRNLSDVAAAAGISISMLSQIERGIVSPSIETLFSVCAAQEFDVRDLFGKVSPPAPVRVTPAANHLKTEKGGIRYEQIVASPDPQHPAEIFLLVVQPGCLAGISGRGHEGVELGYVLKGDAVITVDGVEYPVSEGDGVSFSSHLPHRLSNTGDAEFRALWTVLPPHTEYLDIE